MAKSKKDAGGQGLTPTKGAIIGVLAVVLVGVLYKQFGGGGSEADLPAYEPPTAAARPAPRAKASRVPKVEPTTDVAEAVLTTFDPTRWEPPELTAVVAYDPFARPDAFPKPQVLSEGAASPEEDAALAEQRVKELAAAVEQLQKQLEELQQRGVQVIVGGSKDGEYVAVIGDRTLHVGDKINGFTVTAIEPDGVRVETTGVE